MSQTPVVVNTETGEEVTLEGLPEIPHFLIYGVEGYDEEKEEFWRQESVDGEAITGLEDGVRYRVVEDGVSTGTITTRDENSDQ